MTTTPASIFQHFHLTAHSLKIASHVWSFANRWLLCPSFLFYTRSHEYEQFLIILDSVKSEPTQFHPRYTIWIRSLYSHSYKMLFTTLEFCFTIKIRSFTFVSCMISTIIPRCFQTVFTNTFSAHIDNSEFRDFNIKNLTIKSNTSFRSYVCSR